MQHGRALPAFLPFKDALIALAKCGAGKGLWHLRLCTNSPESSVRAGEPLWPGNSTGLGLS
jgi:hypothetical protein